ncbi:MAG: hypothetical protein RIB60_00365 [Phycisphaerales bacterium]
MTHHHDQPGSGSLLEGLEQAAAPKRSRPTTAQWLRGISGGLGSWFKSAWAHPTSRVLVGASALMIATSGALGAWLALRPVSKPDYESGGLDTLFNYTLLTDEFNRLPIDERIELIGQLVARMQGMDGSDSVLLAAFAASITGEARDQLIENASLIMVDLTDRAAAGYDPGASEAERTAYIESSVVEMMRAMRTMAGETDDVSDEELLNDAREQAARDAEAFSSGDVTADQLGQMSGLLTRTVGMSSSTQQKLRMARFGRDMSRTLREQGAALRRERGP